MLSRKAFPLAMLLSLGGVLMAGFAFAADWPLSPPLLAANFGSFAKGRIFTGVALAAAPSDSSAAVHAVEDGEIAFSAEEGDLPSGLPSAFGTFVIVEHRDGMAAVYSHLSPGTVKNGERKLKSGDVIASPGRSGWIEGPGMVYQVFDRKASAWVNPYLLLPPLPDTAPPAIRSLALSRAGATTVIGASSSVQQGTYRISVEVADPADAPWSAAALAPYLIRLSIDGAEITQETFDVAKSKGGKLVLFGQNPIAAQVLRTPEGRYQLAERLFTRGKTVIEVRIEDAAGNKRSASWTVLVE